MQPGTWVCRLASFALLGAMTFAGSARAAGMQCDRGCLRGFIDAYLDAMVAHDPGRVALADDVRFTEDAAVLDVGEGLWKTASGVSGYRQDIIDVRAGIAASQVKIEENGRAALLVLRLGVVDKKIAEIETMVVRSAAEGVIFDVDGLTQANDAMAVVPPPSQRAAREDAVEIAALYPAGLKAGSFVAVDAPFASDAYRFENGRLMAGLGCTFMPGCEDIKSQRIPTLAEIRYRVAAVDAEQGIVLLRLDFGAGSVREPDESLIVWEAFKVYGGQIHAVEAFMERSAKDSGSGWEDEALGYDPAVDPFEQVRSAQVRAQASHKLVLVMAGGEWCIWCHYLHAFLERNADIGHALEGTFVVVKAYFGEKNENDAFFSTLPKAAGYPHFWVLSADGTLLESQNTLPLENGDKSYDRRNFMAFVDQWSARLAR
jgi:hypothetical protein